VISEIPCTGAIVASAVAIQFAGSVRDNLNRFFRFRQPAFSQLGPLEERLMQKIWSRGNATARELLRAAKPPFAYTTVMTTLDRLYKKRLLTRVSEGRAFRYSPKASQQEMQRAGGWTWSWGPPSPLRLREVVHLGSSV